MFRAPMTYASGGKQYLVSAAGGHEKLGTKQGDYVIAFGLPWNAERRMKIPRAALMQRGR